MPIVNNPNGHGFPEGFAEASSAFTSRLIIASDGRERSGKTHFGLTLPDPVAVLPLDIGTEEIIAKFRRAGRKVMVPKENLDFDSGKPKADYEKILRKVKDSYYRCLESKAIRSLFIDTGSELWELWRLAEFGKLVQVKPHHYAKPNEEFRAFVRDAYASNKNVVFSHKVKKQYVGKGDSESWNGKYERAGMTDIGFLAQSNIHHNFDPITRSFYLTIEDCRANPDIANTTVGLGSKEDGTDKYDFAMEPTFQTIGQLAYPDSREEDWK